jgi:hypothetical protein
MPADTGGAAHQVGEIAALPKRLSIARRFGAILFEI